MIVKIGSSGAVAELFAYEQCPLPKRVYSLVNAQASLSQTFAFYENEVERVPLSVVGFAPLNDRAADFWFCVRSRVLGRQLLSGIREMNKILSLIKSSYPGGIFCFVQDGHRPGERLATLTGFKLSDVKLGPHRRWNYQVME